MTGATPKRDGANGHRTRLWLTLIMATVTLVATATGGAILYQVSFEQQRARLIELVRSQARLIESVARFDSIHSQEDHPGGALAATLSQVSEAYAQDEEFNSTGELILARREGGKIVFLISHRYGNNDIPQPVRLDSGLAEPMRRALDRQSGTMVGPDYRNVTVLAAYEPLKALNLALVAKIDLSEIRAPFIKAGAITGATALVFILLGAALFHRISDTLIARLRSSVINLNRAQRIANLGDWDWNVATGELQWSDQIYRIFGLEPQQFGATYEAFLQSVHPDDRDMVEAAVDRAVNESAPYAIDHRIVLPDGRERIVHEQGEVIFDTSGKALRMTGTVQDITEQKRAEREVIELNEELERRVEERTSELHAAQEELLRQERLATLGQLTATVSHELRNPLGVIRISAYSLRATLGAETASASRALERVERSVVRCDRIIDELLDFTRITGLEPESALLDDWLAAVLDEQVLPGGIVLHRDFGLPATHVAFDRDRFRRAVINVFENACQAMLGEEGLGSTSGGQVLRVRTQARAGRIEVVFEDQGPGIPAEVYERIFEPLFSTKGFGVGLGLPVVKQIMEQHGGGIEIETELGRGTTVRLWLDPEAGAKGAAA